MWSVYSNPSISISVELDPTDVTTFLAILIDSSELNIGNDVRSHRLLLFDYQKLGR
jgi:hypothetical protein